MLPVKLASGLWGSNDRYISCTGSGVASRIIHCHQFYHIDPCFSIGMGRVLIRGIHVRTVTERPVPEVGVFVEVSVNVTVSGAIPDFGMPMLC
jgi:hypothetical protein